MRRGTELREHIIFAAKMVFLEIGFERASMDLIAARAKTSKRTLYAHFESKEKLFLAFIDLIREMQLANLQMPADYSSEPIEAITLYCGRYLEGLLYIWTARMSRLAISEAERFPEGAIRYHETIFTIPFQRLSSYLQTTYNLSQAQADSATERLLGQVIYPSYQCVLFGVQPARTELSEHGPASDFDLSLIREAVTGLLANLRA